MPKKQSNNNSSKKITNNSHNDILFDIELINDALKKLYNLRKNSEYKRWDDYEEESASEDFSFKNAEALHAMLLPLGSLQEINNFSKAKEIQEDLAHLLNRCLNNGKEKLNYSPGVLLFPETKDSLVDFACTTLRLFLLAKRLVYNKKNTEKVDKLIVKTTEVLLKSALPCELGNAWESILIQENSKNMPDTYFTSSAMLALYDAVISDVSPLSSREKDSCREAIIKASYWIEGRFNENTVFSNEEAGISSIVYFTYALTALLTCWDLLDEDRQRTCNKMVNAYLKALNTTTTIAPKLYYPISVSDNKAALSYEDRSALGSVLTVLSLIKHRLGSEPDFKQKEYSTQMTRVFEEVLADRNLNNMLWSGTRTTIYATYRAIQGLIHHSLYMRKLPSTLSEGDIVSVVLEVLNGRAVRGMIIARLYTRANELSTKELQEKLAEKS